LGQSNCESSASIAALPARRKCGRIGVGVSLRIVHARTALLAALLATAVPAGCGGDDEQQEPLPRAKGGLELESPAFSAGATIPDKYTCVGGDVSPPLRWRGAPSATKELALVVEDPDGGGFLHWTVLNIPPRADRFPEGALPSGASETENDFEERAWGGPCPPEGDDPHRYVFVLYALRKRLGLGPDASRDQVRRALAGAALARGTLTGRFGR
jgi:Raf kinase inhibitor-like YbhB/YbcL family protein